MDRHIYRLKSEDAKNLHVTFYLYQDYVRDRWIEALLGGRLRFHVEDVAVETHRWDYWSTIVRRWHELYRDGIHV